MGFQQRRKIVIDLIQKLCQPSDLVGAEIGVYLGQMSMAILNECSIKFFYAIDPYEGNYSSLKENTDANQAEMDKRFIKVKNRLELRHKEKVQLIRKNSSEACNDIPYFLDFIYIDGNHKYKFVLEDLTLWIPKVKKGGLIIGDDWSGKFPGVIKAVTDYCEKHKNVFIPPYNNYKKFNFITKHVAAPGKGTAIVNKSERTWWTLKK